VGSEMCIRDSQRDTLAPAEVGDLDLVALAAARLGKTRLIDSLEISVKH
jgi:pantothenate synthetase